MFLGLPENYYLTKPGIHFTSIDFDYSRTSLQASHPGITQPPPSSNECKSLQDPPPLSSSICQFLTIITSFNTDNIALCWFADSKGGQGQEVIINGVRRGVSPKQRRLEKFR